MCKIYPKYFFSLIYLIILFLNSKFKSEQMIGIFAFRLPQIVAIGPEFIKSIMINNFKFFMNNEFSYQVC